MSKTTPAAVPDAPPAPPSDRVSRREMQRSALRDLAALARDCATTEAEIETRYRAALEAADQQYEQKVRAIEAHEKSLRQSIEQKHQARRDEATAHLEQESAGMAASDRATRARAEQEYAAAQQAIKERFEQATWLAESVCEGTLARIRDDLKLARDEQDKRTGSIDELLKQADALLRKYGVPVPAVEEAEHGPAGSAETFEQARTQADAALLSLGSLSIPRLFTGVRPYFWGFLAIVAGALVGQAVPFFASNGLVSLAQPQFEAILLGAFGGLGLLAILGIILRAVGKSQVRAAYLPLVAICAQAKGLAKCELDGTARDLEARYGATNAKRKAEIQAARDSMTPLLARAAKRREEMLAAADAERTRLMPGVGPRREKAMTEVEDWRQRHLTQLEQKYQESLDNARRDRDQAKAQADREHSQSRADLERRLREGLAQTQAPLDAGAANGADAASPDFWKNWQPPREFASSVPFGRLDVDLRRIAGAVPRAGSASLQLPPAFTMPATLGFPRQASLLIETDHEGRNEAVRTLQMVMTRLLTSLPPGRVRFTIFDPVSLGQNFAGFMHLADHDEALVGGRIWTESEHIEHRLADLTEHMETVIQKYLRNEFETIDDYNAQADELAEPYRFLVIADFPTSFEGEAFRRLASIASSGARCGVYTLILRDLRQELPSGVHMDELVGSSVRLAREQGKWTWKDEVYGQFPLTLDGPPPDDVLSGLLDKVGVLARDAKRVEVPFRTIMPDDQQFWSADATEEIRVPIGKMGATRLQSLRLGRGVAQHALVAGKTGSGKSTLLHVLVTNMALWYSPDEVEFYLVDFKKGVEFKTYASHLLPHARAIAVESDREFGLSVLQRLDAELTRRGELYRAAGVQDLAAYRALKGVTRLPRTLLIIDEFQEFFSEDDKLAQDAALLLDRLVRQGRAFGVHVLLGSQTIGGSSGLSRSTLGQMAVRLALQCSEADSQMILGDNNSAARLLSRPGDAIYNDAGGLVEANSPFQVAWLPDEERDVYLKRIEDKTAQLAPQRREPAAQPVVFEGNAPADITKNRRLAALLDAPGFAPVAAPVAYLGEPVAIKDPTAVMFRRQSGANLLIIGQQERSALSILSSAVISLSAQHAPGTATFHVFDGTPADSPLVGYFNQLKSFLPHELHLPEYRAASDTIVQLAAEMKQRQEAEAHGAPAVYLFIYGLQRYRALRKQEESFSFSTSEEEKPPQPDKLFVDILREGSALGIHCLIWADTPVTLDRTLDRAAMREFDYRVLFQMSATDSSNLIDSPVANKLGFHRALAYSEEQGMVEKFRPYALPEEPFLNRVKAALSNRTTA